MFFKKFLFCSQLQGKKSGFAAPLCERKCGALSLFFSHVHFEKPCFSKILHGNIIRFFCCIETKFPIQQKNNTCLIYESNKYCFIDNLLVSLRSIIGAHNRLIITMATRISVFPPFFCSLSEYLIQVGSIN